MESIAIGVRVTALSWESGVLWIASEDGPTVWTYGPDDQRFRARFDLEVPIVDLIATREGLWVLGRDGTGVARIVEVDPVDGRVRRELSGVDPATRGLVGGPGGVWSMREGSQTLGPIEGDAGTSRGPIVPEGCRAPTEVGGRWWAISVQRDGPVRPFRWRGLAPGPDPARPGAGSSSRRWSRVPG